MGKQTICEVFYVQYTVGIATSTYSTRMTNSVIDRSFATIKTYLRCRRSLSIERFVKHGSWGSCFGNTRTSREPLLDSCVSETEHEGWIRAKLGHFPIIRLERRLVNHAGFVGPFWFLPICTTSFAMLIARFSLLPIFTPSSRTCLRSSRTFCASSRTSRRTSTD